jgi:hypothetical protein
MNSTLDFVVDHYPDYLIYLPREYWDLPVLSRHLALTTVLIFSILMFISVGGNSLMVFVFVR